MSWKKPLFLFLFMSKPLNIAVGSAAVGARPVHFGLASLGVLFQKDVQYFGLKRLSSMLTKVCTRGKIWEGPINGQFGTRDGRQVNWRPAATTPCEMCLRALVVRSKRLRSCFLRTPGAGGSLFPGMPISYTSCCRRSV